MCILRINSLARIIFFMEIAKRIFTKSTNAIAHIHIQPERVCRTHFMHICTLHTVCVLIQYTCTLNARRNRKLKMKPQFFSIFVCHPLWFCNPKYERIRGLNNRQKWMQNQCCNHENITSHVKIHTHNSPIMLRAVVVGMNFCVGLSEGGFATPWV